jgi:hypothetical protein
MAARPNPGEPNAIPFGPDSEPHEVCPPAMRLRDELTAR